MSSKIRQVLEDVFAENAAYRILPRMIIFKALPLLAFSQRSEFLFRLDPAIEHERILVRRALRGRRLLKFYVFRA